MTVKDNRRAFDRELNGRIVQALAKSANAVHNAALRRLSVPNDDDWNPSQPNAAPHRNEGREGRGIAWHVDENKLEAFIGILEGFPELYFMEVGTAAHFISGGGKMLKIPWRGDRNGVRREPTEEEIKRLGLVLDSTSVRQVKRGQRKGQMVARHGNWVYFRAFVNHPGTLPRPFLMPALLGSREEIAKAFEGLDSPSASFGKGTMQPVDL